MTATDTTTLDTTNVVNEAVNKRIAQYVQIRDELAKKKEAYENSIKPLVEVQNLLTGWLQEFLDQAGAESVKTKHGTCYQNTRYSASLADPDAFMAFVRSTNNYDLLDRKANVTAIREFVVEKNVLPPGVNLSAIKTVGVRRASGK